LNTVHCMLSSLHALLADSAQQAHSTLHALFAHSELHALLAWLLLRFGIRVKVSVGVIVRVSFSVRVRVRFGVEFL